MPSLRRGGPRRPNSNNPTAAPQLEEVVVLDAEVELDTGKNGKDKNAQDLTTEDREQDEPPSWQVFEFDDLATARERTKELQVLVALHQTTTPSGATTADGWTNSSGWLTEGVIPCHWAGVVCNSDQFVVGLELHNNNLQGTLPASLLWELSYLIRVDLSLNPNLVVDMEQKVIVTTSTSTSTSTNTVDNNNNPPLVVVVSKQEFTPSAAAASQVLFGTNNKDDGVIAPVEYLNISHTATQQLNGVSDLGTTLQVLDLSSTQVQRLSQADLGPLAQLTFLAMNHLNLQRNNDPLLAWLPAFPNATTATATSFSTTATASEDFPLRNLRYWYASNASLAGTIPAFLQQAPRFPELPLKLQYLDWSYNQLTGSLPVDFLAAKFPESTPSLDVLLQHNQLTGGIPSSLSRFSNLFLGVTDNQMTDPVPEELCKSNEWMDGAVDSYGCSAILCPAGTFNALGRQLYLDAPCLPCPGTTTKTTLFLGQTTCDEMLQLVLDHPDAPQVNDTTAVVVGDTAVVGDDDDDESWNNDNEGVGDDDNAITAVPEDVPVVAAELEPVEAAEENVDPQYQALADFYQATGGPDWTNNDGWLEQGTSGGGGGGPNNNAQNSVCDWFGVSCQRGAIRELLLPGNNLQGTVPPLFFQEVDTLQSVFLQDNPELVVDFSQINSTLSELEDLILSRTATTTLQGISNFPELRILNANGTQLAGPSSVTEIYNLTKLRTLNIANNNLEQGIPRSISNLVNLVSFRASNAALTGTLPSDIGQLRELVALDLSGNNLEGPLSSDSLNALQDLRILDLHGQTSGIGGPLPALEGLRSLLQVDLSANAITGPIPLDFLSGIRDRSRNIDVSLKGNQISGSVPLELSLFQSLNLDVTDNQIESIPEAFCSLDQWMNGLVSEFGCDAIVCPPGTSNAYGRTISAEAPCTVCSEEPLLYYGSASCSSTASTSESPNMPTTIPPSSSTGDSVSQNDSLTSESTGIPTTAPSSTAANDGNSQNDSLANALTDSPTMASTSTTADAGVAQTDSPTNQPTVIPTIAPSSTAADDSIAPSTDIPTTAPSPSTADSNGQSISSTSEPNDITTMTPSSTGADDSLSQREILELLYTATDGESSWLRKDNWLDSDINVCEWYGVACGDGLQVQALELSANGLKGTTPPDLFQLSRLERLFLDANRELVVDLSSIGSKVSSNLRAIVAGNTATASAVGISMAPALQMLDLNATSVGSEVLDEISSLTSLQTLNLGNTRLDRALPNEIGDFAAEMRELIAPNASLTGTIPASLGRLTRLVVLNLGDNMLTGPLPESFRDLVHLQILDLHRQNPSAGGIRGQLLPFDQIRSIAQMDLSSNSLSGSIPASFLSGISDKSEGLDVILKNNLLSGRIPDALASFTELNLDVTSNLISGVPDTLCSQGLWMNGNVDSYGCDAILCPPGTYNAFGRQLADNEPCDDCVESPEPFFGAASCSGTSSESGTDPNPWSSAGIDLNMTVSPTQIGSPIQMEKQTCPDGNVCENGGICVETDNGSSYTCDCFGTGQIPFAGDHCQFPATSLCSPSAPYTSFCVNGGACISLVQVGAEHGNCSCPEGFDGQFCQVTTTISPEFSTEESPTIPSGSEEGMESWQMVLVFVLPALAILIILAMIVGAYSWKKRRL